MEKTSSILMAGRKAIAVTSLVFCAIGAGLSLAIAPSYTAKASFLAPQQSQVAASAALAALGSLGGLAASSLRTPIDQYVSLLESVRVNDRIIDRFKLLDLYGEAFKHDARIALKKRTNFTASRKDNFIFVEVDDESPERAAAMANAYIEELKDLTSVLALTETQQRRLFFEGQLAQTKERLVKAQSALEAAGYSTAAMNTDAKVTADRYAKAKAEAAAAQLQLHALRRGLTEAAPEVRRQQAVVAGLLALVREMERPADKDKNAAYVSAYRDYKYQETLFDIYAKQFEAAKLDEARESPLIQVIDSALPPERRSKPKRVSMTLLFAAFGLVFGSLGVLLRHFRKLPPEQPMIS